MADHQAKVYNEKLKGFALMLRNGALVVATAGIAQWFTRGFGLLVGLELASASLLTYMGVALLSLMQQED